jgi:hypothetical protein
MSDHPLTRDSRSFSEKTAKGEREFSGNCAGGFVRHPWCEDSSNVGRDADVNGTEAGNWYALSSETQQGNVRPDSFCKQFNCFVFQSNYSTGQGTRCTSLLSVRFMDAKIEFIEIYVPFCVRCKTQFAVFCVNISAYPNTSRLTTLSQIRTASYEAFGLQNFNDEN